MSSGSGELYNPHLSEIDSDSDENDDVGNVEIAPNLDDHNISDDSEDEAVAVGQQQRWVRVYPPDEPANIENKFKVRNTGIQNCPRNSPPLSYFYLFFTASVWNLIVTETNKYAQHRMQSKRDSGNFGPQSRFHKWVDLTTHNMK